MNLITTMAAGSSFSSLTSVGIMAATPNNGNDSSKESTCRLSYRKVFKVCYGYVVRFKKPQGWDKVIWGVEEILWAHVTMSLTERDQLPSITSLPYSFNFWMVKFPNIYLAWRLDCCGIMSQLSKFLLSILLNSNDNSIIGSMQQLLLDCVEVLFQGLTISMIQLLWVSLRSCGLWWY